MGNISIAGCICMVNLNLIHKGVFEILSEKSVMTMLTICQPLQLLLTLQKRSSLDLHMCAS